MPFLRTIGFRLDDEKILQLNLLNKLNFRIIPIYIGLIDFHKVKKQYILVVG